MVTITISVATTATMATTIITILITLVVYTFIKPWVIDYFGDLFLILIEYFGF